MTRKERRAPMIALLARLMLEDVAREEKAKVAPRAKRKQNARSPEAHHAIDQR